MDDKSVDRILADMKKAPGSKRVDFLRFEDGTFGHVRAKRELRKDIELSIAVCEASEEIGEPKNVKKIRAALVKIRDQLHGCQQLLEESAAAASRLATACAPDITNPKSALSAMASGAADEIERLGNLQQFEGDRHT